MAKINKASQQQLTLYADPAQQPFLLSSDNPKRTGIIIQNHSNNDIKIGFGSPPSPLGAVSLQIFTGLRVKAQGGIGDTLQITTHCPTSQLWAMIDYGGGNPQSDFNFIEIYEADVSDDKGGCQ